MPFYTYDSARVEIDDKGYLVRFGDWTPVLATALARDDGVAELAAEHWRVIDFLRAHQQQHGVAPMIRVLCKETGFALKEIYRLFPKGPAKGACRIAGLPRPDSCV